MWNANTGKIFTPARGKGSGPMIEFLYSPYKKKRSVQQLQLAVVNMIFRDIRRWKIPSRDTILRSVTYPKSAGKIISNILSRLENDWYSKRSKVYLFPQRYITSQESARRLLRFYQDASLNHPGFSMTRFRNALFLVCMSALSIFFL